MGEPIARAKPTLRLIDCERQQSAEDQQATIDCLHALLARAERGQLPNGFVAYFVDDAGQGQIARTGRYERDAGALSLAGFQLQSIALDDSDDTE